MRDPTHQNLSNQKKRCDEGSGQVDHENGGQLVQCEAGHRRFLEQREFRVGWSVVIVNGLIRSDKE